MNVRLGIALGLLVATYSTNGTAVGVLQLSRTEVTLAPNRPPEELWVENKGDTPLYLDVTQQLVGNPGSTPEQLVPVEDVSRPELLVLPGRLTLAPGQQYRMTLRELSVPPEPRVWRVTFRPREHVLIDVDAAGQIPAPLVVSIGYGAVIYQYPAER